jgi:hypothetical protein
MNLVFPTHLLFPSYPTRPTEPDELGASAFFQALREFFQHLTQQRTSTGRYFDAARFYLDDSNQENVVRTNSADVTGEAIAAVIKNMNQPTDSEYVWDPVQDRWVLKSTPI